MEYGAKYLQWAPFAASNPEPTGALPNYGTAVNLGEMVKVSDNPSFTEASAAGDNNATARYIRKFQQCPVDAEILEMLNEVASSVFGATLDTTSGKKDLHFNVADKPPYGGMAFFTEGQLKDGSTAYQGIFYPKLKANMQGKEYSTTGTSITFSSRKVQFMAMACGNGDWKIQSEYFATEAAAKAWVDAKLAAST